MRFGRFFRRVDSARRQYGLDSWNDAVQKPRLSEHVAAGDAHMTFGVLARQLAPGDLRGHRKGRRHDSFELEDVSDVVNETQRSPAMQKADGRRIAGGKNGGLRKTVKARSPGG